jgi:hypothetical protein
VTYRIETFDLETRRNVKHQAIRAESNHEAVEVAVKRRHRLGKNWWVIPTTDYSTVQGDYEYGTYEVWTDGAVRPGFGGRYIMNRFPDLPKRS